ncbi:GNAT family N-acetyltransferase [Streptomyces sp. NBC_01351]|uniref:GNAT family N-acetyltransferase n=1 Tax=Streptomyces sp. NBC_01351 TaxID=2903833 RepID=UPI003FCE3E15
MAPATGPAPTPTVIRSVVLATERLDLVPLRPSHADEMARVLADPALHRFIGGTPLSPDALRARYERLAAGSPDPGVVWCNWVLRRRAGRGLVGTVQATVTPARGLAELAWTVGTPWQGLGFAGEAARALAGWLRELPVGLLVAHVHPAHAASAAVAAACGLRPTGELQDGEIRWESGGGPGGGVTASE